MYFHVHVYHHNGLSFSLLQRYFTLQGGILTCARNPVQMSKGKILSRTDLGFAVITCDSSRWKIDIDEERQVYHLKVCVREGGRGGREGGREGGRWWWWWCIHVHVYILYVCARVSHAYTCV